MARFKVSYQDGRTETISSRPVGLVAAERHYKGDVPPFEGTCYAVWFQLHTDVPFDEWLESVEDIEQDEKAVPVPPPEPPPPEE